MRVGWKVRWLIRHPSGGAHEPVDVAANRLVPQGRIVGDHEHRVDVRGGRRVSSSTSIAKFDSMCFVSSMSRCITVMYSVMLVDVIPHADVGPVVGMDIVREARPEQGPVLGVDARGVADEHVGDQFVIGSFHGHRARLQVNRRGG